MKKTRLIIAALALLGIAACQKIETPDVQQEEPEVAVAQEPAPEPEQEVAQEATEEPAAIPDVKSVAAALNEVAEKDEVKLFIKDVLIMVKEGKDARHFEFEVASTKEGYEGSYIAGSLGLVVGDLHPVAIDLDLVVLGMIPVVGQLDLVQISTNYALAALALDNFSCEFYLKKASEGLGISIYGAYKLAFLRGEDENGKRTMDLYLYNPADPNAKPFPLSTLFSTIIKG